jgi:hypothetical protein
MAHNKNQREENDGHTGREGFMSNAKEKDFGTGKCHEI